jgi:hypothetical protein
VNPGDNQMQSNTTVNNIGDRRCWISTIRCIVYLKLLLSAVGVTIFGILPLLQGIRILTGSVNRENFDDFDECSLIYYFSAAQACLLIGLGLLMVGLTYFAFFARSFTPILVGVCISIFVITFLTYGACLNGK